MKAHGTGLEKVPRLSKRWNIIFYIFTLKILCCKLEKSTKQFDIRFPLLVMEYLNFASDFSFLHEEKIFQELVVPNATISSKDKVFLVAKEVYSLSPSQGVVRRYATWTGGGEQLIGEVRDYL